MKSQFQKFEMKTGYREMLLNIVWLGLAIAAVYWFARAAGLTDISFWKFLVVVVPVGIVPHIVLVAFGEALSRYATALHPLVLVTGYLASIGIMAGGGYWFYRRAQRLTPS